MKILNLWLQEFLYYKMKKSLRSQLIAHLFSQIFNVVDWEWWKKNCGFMQKWQTINYCLSPKIVIKMGVELFMVLELKKSNGMFKDFMEHHHFIGTNYILINYNTLFKNIQNE